ncbi:NAD(P)/FAD-dependent oxidoreductase [Lentisphaerota bacterium WC36G]|nr:NAD(P)/FAD-dependent oxidoreductase [Lentisphaerae bacterium WC36]
MTKQIIIIGAGASGLMTAAILAEKIAQNKQHANSAEITVIERMNRCGLKLLASGGGRCNVTNVLSSSELMKSFGKHGRFMNDAIQLMDNEKLIAWFDQNNVPLECVDKMHYFPKSKKSSDIVNMLVDKCLKYNVKFIKSCKVTSCQLRCKDKLANHGFILQTSDEQVFNADYVVFSTGGVSYKKLGGSKSGYKILADLGHKIISPLPGMVGLNVQENWVKKSTGIAFGNTLAVIGLKKYRKKNSYGELLFTHEGLSANAAINISADIAELLENAPTVPLIIKLFADKSNQEMINQWSKCCQENSTKSVVKVLSFFVPKSVAVNYLTDFFGEEILQCTIAQLPKKVNQKIIELLTECIVTITKTNGFDKAMVTRGGVDLKNLNPKTLESKIVEGLFCTGEAVNLDGPCGGYNLQWAFSSGYLAAYSIYQKIIQK